MRSLRLSASHIRWPTSDILHPNQLAPQPHQHHNHTTTTPTPQPHHNHTTPTPHQHHNRLKLVWCGCGAVVVRAGLGEGCHLLATVLLYTNTAHVKTNKKAKEIWQNLLVVHTFARWQHKSRPVSKSSVYKQFCSKARQHLVLTLRSPIRLCR